MSDKERGREKEKVGRERCGELEEKSDGVREKQIVWE